MFITGYSQDSFIRGSVYDSKTKKPISNAHIKIQQSNKSTTSSEKGRFYLEGLSEGTYQIEISHLSFKKLIETANIVKGENRLEFELIPEIYNTKTVVITATRSERNIDDIPARIEVINRKEIEQIPAQKLDDILQYTAGINVSRSGGIFTMRPVVTLRGLSGDEQGRTLVLIDGVPINKGDTGGANWNRINKDDIEKIEIYKGPGSSLYGNNAMGGMINIITRKPKKKAEGNAAFSYGTYNTKNGSFFIGSRYNDNAYVKLSGFITDSDGYNAIPDSLKTEPDYSVPRFLKEHGLSAKTGYRLNRQMNLEFQYDYYKDKRGEGEKIELPDGEYRHFNTHFFRGRINGLIKKFRYDFMLFYQYENYFRSDERMRGEQYSHFDVDSDRKDRGMILNMSHPLGEKQLLSFGFESKQSSVNGGDYYKTSPDSVLNKGKMNNLAFYLQNEVSLVDDKLKLLAGVRYDRVKFYDGAYSTTDGAWTPILPKLEDHTWNAFSPRISTSFELNKNLKIYLSYSFGFRASILDDLCRSGWMWVGPKIANPELGPEKLNNYEAGANVKIGKKFKILPSVYFSKGKDFLYYVQTTDSLWGKRPVFKRENITSVTVYGAEIEFRYMISENFSCFSNYTFNQSKIDEFLQNPGLSGKDLTFTPRHQAKTGFFWQNRWFSTNVNTIYKSRQFADDQNKSEIKPYAILNLSISKKAFKLIDLSLSVQNVFDNRHMENTLYMSPGRIIMIKTGVTF